MATEVSRAPQSQNLTNRRSWMVQPCIRLLAGRFRVQILVAEPSRWRQLRHCFEAAQACAPVGRAHRSIRVDKPQVAAAQVYVAVSDSPVEGAGRSIRTAPLPAGSDRAVDAASAVVTPVAACTGRQL